MDDELDALRIIAKWRDYLNSAKPEELKILISLSDNFVEDYEEICAFCAEKGI